MAPITIRGNSVDPAKIASASLVPDANKTNYLLVQLKGPLNKETANALQKKGVALVKLMSENCWLCRRGSVDTRDLQALPLVQLVIGYLVNFKLQKSLKDIPTSSTGKLEVVIVLHDELSTAPAVAAEIKKIQGVEIFSASGTIIFAKVSRAALEQIVPRDDIQAIEQPATAHLTNMVARQVVRVDAAHTNLEAYKRTPLEGAGQIIAVVDDGLDPTHKAFSAAGKIVHSEVIKMVGDKNKIDPAKNKLHGTHVAGTALGDPVAGIRGIAPGARLVMQSGAPTDPMPVQEVAQSAYDHKARIQSHSWGGNLHTIGWKFHVLPYSVADAEQLDIFAVKYPDMLFVFSAGNDGLETSVKSQMVAWANAKNVLTVGASHNDRLINKEDKVVSANDGEGERKPGQVAAFSSWGLASGGWVKPDLVAPGTGILSARADSKAEQAVAQGWIAEYGSPPEASAVDERFIYCNGTSMATPVVSGCAALLREALIRLNRYPQILGLSKKSLDGPSAPLLKALLINGADVLNWWGTVDDPVWIEAQGFGRLNMERTLKHLEGKESPSFCQDIWPAELEGRQRPLNIMTPAAVKGGRISFSATLAYHDHPGDQIHTQIQMEVSVPQVPGSKTFNKPPSANLPSKTQKEPQINNVQRIVIKDVEPGKKGTITLTSKGVVLDDTWFALAWCFWETEPESTPKK